MREGETMTTEPASNNEPPPPRSAGPTDISDPLLRFEARKAMVWIGIATLFALVAILAQPLLVIFGGMVFGAMIDGGARLIERTLAAAGATKIEPQRREAAVHEGVVELVDDRVIHRPTELWMRMKDDCDRRVLLARRVVAPLDAPGGAGEDDLRHGSQPRTCSPCRRQDLLCSGGTLTNPADRLELF